MYLELIQGVLMKALIVLALLLLHSAAEAAAPSYCVEKYEVFDNTQVQMNPSGNDCFVSVHSRDSYVDLIYKDFLLASSGLFLIFNSYGAGNESDTTAAREFHFFPRTKAALEYRYDATSNQILVTTTSGKIFVFDAAKAVLVRISGTSITQDYDITPTNKGGIEIVQNDGLFMDGGFKIGQSPSQNPKNKVTFRDSRGNHCQLVNSDIYRYTADNDAILKYNDGQLKSFLAQRCPQIRN